MHKPMSDMIDTRAIKKCKKCQVEYQKHDHNISKCIELTEQSEHYQHLNFVFVKLLCRARLAKLARPEEVIVGVWASLFQKKKVASFLLFLFESYLDLIVYLYLTYSQKGRSISEVMRHMPLFWQAL